MPFDRFTVEQLAGDLLPDADAATRRSPPASTAARTINVEAGIDPEEIRVNQVVDRVNTTGTVWLGTDARLRPVPRPQVRPDHPEGLLPVSSPSSTTPRSRPTAPTPRCPARSDSSARRLTLPRPGHAAERRSCRPSWPRSDRRNSTPRAQRAAASATRTGRATSWPNGGKAASVARPGRGRFRFAGRRLAQGAGRQSVLLGGEPPDKDTYTVTVKTELTGITGFKLEALTDPSLPGKGPGRGDAKRPNFVLNTLPSTAAPTARARPKPVKLRSGPGADFSQENFDVAGAIDDDPKTAWAHRPAVPQAALGHLRDDRARRVRRRHDADVHAGAEFRRRPHHRPAAASAITGDPQAGAAVAGRGRRDPAAKRRTEQAPTRSEPTAERHSTGLAKQLDDELRKTPRPTRRPCKPVTTLVMQELPTAAARRTSSSAATTATPGEAGLAGHARGAARRCRRRAAPTGSTLARWLVEPDNPLIGPRDGQPLVGRVLRPGAGQHAGGLRHQGRAADAPGAARLAGGRVHGTAAGR